MSFMKNLPIAGCLMLASALIGFIASSCIWKQRWRIAIVLFLLMYVVADLAAVFLAQQR
jgi:hypothetical protein